MFRFFGKNVGVEWRGNCNIDNRIDSTPRPDQPAVQRSTSVLLSIREIVVSDPTRSSGVGFRDFGCTVATADEDRQEGIDVLSRRTRTGSP
ncbi:MAG: hypothetical protein CMJ47_12935 [Planctomyces sp.]|nr:hypothetical protein [Planctomyces sp.]